jgi:hypothetical protein
MANKLYSSYAKNLWTLVGDIIDNPTSYQVLEASMVFPTDEEPMAVGTFGKDKDGHHNACELIRMRDEKRIEIDLPVFRYWFMEFTRHEEYLAYNGRPSEDGQTLYDALTIKGDHKAALIKIEYRKRGGARKLSQMMHLIGFASTRDAMMYSLSVSDASLLVQSDGKFYSPQYHEWK